MFSNLLVVELIIELVRVFLNQIIIKILPMWLNYITPLWICSVCEGGTLGVVVYTVPDVLLVVEGCVFVVDQAAGWRVVRLYAIFVVVVHLLIEDLISPSLSMLRQLLIDLIKLLFNLVRLQFQIFIQDPRPTVPITCSI